MNDPNRPAVDQNVASLLGSVADGDPDKPALVFEQDKVQRSITFGRLWHDASCVASGLRHLGLRDGQRVIIMIPMSIDLYVSLLAVIQMGAVAVFVDPWMGARQIARFADFADPAAFIGVGKSHLLRWSRARLRKIRISITNGMRVGPFPARYSLESLKKGAAAEGHIAPVTSNQTALITFTSGSSGDPKGANRTHGFLLSQHRALEYEFPYKPDDIDMPMFPVFALNNLVSGITSVVPDMDFKKVSQVNGQTIARQILTQGVTTCTASPPLLDRLGEYLQTLDSSSRSGYRLRRLLTGGAPVSDEQIKSWIDAFQFGEQKTRITIAYGSTEAEPVGHIEARERLELATGSMGYCTGHPTQLIQTRLIPIFKGPVQFNGKYLEDLILGPGEIGELIVAGEHVCRDYYQNEKETLENKLRDQDGTIWHRMGDTGYFDSTGRFWLVGRVHSTIFREGKTIHPQIVEQLAARASHQIVQVAAVGYDDRMIGDALAIVVHARTSNEAGLRQDIQRVVEAQDLVCDRIVFVNHSLPVDPRHNSKIDYAKTRQLISKKIPH